MLSRPVLDGDRLRRRALGDVRRDRGAGAAADRRPRRRPRRDRRRLHRRRRRWRRCWRRSPAATPTGSGGALPYVSGLRSARSAMVAIAVAADARRRPGGADRHLARRRPLLRAGADAALRRRRGQQPAPGLRRRPLEHGLGVGPGASAASAAASSPASPATPLPSIAIAALLLRHRRLRVPRAGAARPSARPAGGLGCGRWRPGQAEAASRRELEQLGRRPGPAGRPRSCARASRDELARRSPPPPRRGARSASPAPGTRSPRRR